jgi:CRP/FNR family transcriptional regulator, cyclic AMP receptor protein
METVSAMEVLRKTPLTAGLGHPERRRLARLCQVRLAEPGEVLLREGGETTRLGVVRSGRVALRLQVPGRGSPTVLTVEAGDVFGWSAVVPPYRATSTAIAIERSELLVFEARALRDALDEDEDLAAAIYPRLLRAVARRLEATRLQLLDVFARAEEAAW